MVETGDRKAASAFGIKRVEEGMSAVGMLEQRQILRRQLESGRSLELGNILGGWSPPRDRFAPFVDLDFIEIAHSWSRHRGQVFVESREKFPARASWLGANIDIGELNPLQKLRGLAYQIRRSL